MLPEINALWIGNTLGKVHAACLVSFLRAGHRVRLHAFETITDLPDGIEIFDATQLMAAEEIIRHKSGSLALASDLYRLRILRQSMGIYVDCDVYCLKPFPDDPYLFGREDENLIGSAILNIPAGSELLQSMMAASEDPGFLPPWRPARLNRKLKWKRFWGRPKSLGDLEWGDVGPQLLTYQVKRLDLEDKVKPADWFYPLHHAHKPLLNDPQLAMGDHVTQRSLAMHLWSSRPAGGKIRPGSVLAQIASELECVP